ncbi:hypothetical protein EYF80_058399 [Liparis tanakae]|uniref:Secreted protein n=1 Tax=Liparis tanakae TaxID=230148 RepID=A0A4Z2ERN2_9TELE|nr:hypothetical protein EYF80_058399 [Liparis tanakae]
MSPLTLTLPLTLPLPLPLTLTSGEDSLASVSTRAVALTACASSCSTSLYSMDCWELRRGLPPR